MADYSTIEWTDATWQPITGCSVVSPGCANCYAMRLAGGRLRHHPSRKGLTVETKAGPVWNGKVRFNEAWLTQPLGWRAAKRIFVCAHGDLFHEDVPDEWIDRVFAVMALAPQHTFQVLTKRAERMRQWFAGRWQGTPAQRIKFSDGSFLDIPAGRETGRMCRVEQACEPLLRKFRLVDTENDSLWTAAGKCKAMQWKWSLPNVWLGVSVEDQRRADERIPHLLATPAAVRFASAEPLLGPIDFTRVGTLDSVRAAMPDAIKREERGRPTSGQGSICGAQIDAIGSPHSSITFFQTPDHMGGFTAASPRRWPRLDQIIAGGESGPNARPMHPDWARSLRDQCAESGTAFFFKQQGSWSPFYDRDRDDPDWRAVPDVDGQAGCGGTRWVNLAGGQGFHGERLVAMRNVGKAAAGRLLDGVEHNAMPEVRA